MSRWWKLYFGGLVLTFLVVAAFGLWIGFDRQQALAEQAAQVAKQQMLAKSRLARPVKEQSWKVYDDYRQNLLEQTLKDPRMKMGDYPTDPNAP
ncbi:MAG: hypothetical protein QM723_09425 [Myxococcaceae bacterium]